MRLLHVEDDGSFSLVEFMGQDVPPYAILSHTWGADNQEVTYQDIVHDTGQRKQGYNKIRFCAKQAIADNLEYFWVDTCCRLVRYTYNVNSSANLLIVSLVKRLT
jgi:hypothetical protein